MGNLENNHWSLSKKIYLRFIFLYTLFYIYPYGFEYIYGFSVKSISFWEDITIWFGESVFDWEFNRDYLYPLGDTKFEYCRLLLVTIFSVFGSIIWMFIDSKIKLNYNLKLKVLIKTILRYHVAFVIIMFGITKVFMIQFGEMDLDRLETKTGDYSGMSFLWSFMSYSKLYTITVGWVEIIGGVLLLLRKTTFIGAFIVFVAMANVVLMDIGFNVTVKIFAIHLFLMTLMLLSNNIKRMIDFFILNKPTLPNTDQALFTVFKFKKVGYVIKGILLLYFIVAQVFDHNEYVNKYLNNRYKSITAFHEIEIFVINGDTIPALKSSKKRWKSLSISGKSYYPETLAIKKMNSKYEERYSFEADTINKVITYQLYDYGITNNEEKKTEYQFKYEQINKGEFVFEGVHKGDSIWMKTKSKTLENYMLTANRLNWIIDL